jgi:hypothetical protein
VKVYIILGSVQKGEVLVHGKAYHDWNLPVRYLVETYGVNREDIIPFEDGDGNKQWRLPKADDHTNFVIHQLDVI